MSTQLTGVVRGNTITLDHTVPPLDGLRVRITLEAVEGASRDLTAEEQHRMLLDWATRGPQGPIEDADPWPDETS
jgi:hypothetical protein